MSCLKCERSIFSKRTKLCRIHYYENNTKYKERSKLEYFKLSSPEVQRTCLCCDVRFMSTGNRRCDNCNRYNDSHYDSNVSLYIGV